MVERLGWMMAKFSGIDGGPVYIDLRQVAAVTDAQAPGELAALGARVILISGLALYTRESAGTVFEEVHRANTQNPPPEPRNKVGDAAPAAEVPAAPPAPIAVPEAALVFREITHNPWMTGGEFLITEQWDTKNPGCPRELGGPYVSQIGPGLRQFNLSRVAWEKAPLVAKPRPATV